MRAVAALGPWGCLGLLGVLAVAAGVVGYAATGVAALAAVAGLAAWLRMAPAGARPRLVVAVAGLAWSGHVAFQVSGLYDRGEWDTFQHTLLPGVVALLAFPLLDRLAFEWRARGRGLRVAVALGVFAGVVALMAVWELYEFAADLWLGTTRQDGLTDTMVDLAVGAAGAAIGVAVNVAFWASLPFRRLRREMHPMARWLTGGRVRGGAGDATVDAESADA